MDPLTLMALGGTALTAIGKLGAGFAGSSLATLQESIANSNYNLLVKKSDAEAEEGQLALAGGALEQSRTIAQVGRTIGGQTGHFAAANLDPTYGSPLLLEGFTAGQGATDVALEGAKGGLGYAGALLQSAGTLSAAAGAKGQATVYGMQASQDIMAGYFGAATALLSGGSNRMAWNNLNMAAGGYGDGSA